MVSASNGKTLRSVLACGLAGFLLVAAASAADRNSSYTAALDSITASDLWRHLGYLAHDGLEGREAGSRGGRLAGDYLASEMRRIGLGPAGDAKTYDQPFAPNYRNLLGIAEGSDPVLKRQVIVVCAHYDHVGYGTNRNSRGPIGYVHNGADDNASGTSGLLELAEAITMLAERPKRTVLFVATDAEERGLLGARYWFAHPTLPLDRVVFGIDLDMIGRLREERLTAFGSRTGAGVRRLVSENNEAGLRLEFPWLIKGNADHYVFFEHKIPVLLLSSGEHEDYHRPTDKVEKINADGERRVLRLVFSLVYDLADRPRLPGFREAAGQETPAMEKELLETPARLVDRLGAEWDDLRDGPVLNKITPATPADKAGLHAGDQIVRFAGREIHAGRDLTRAVRTAPKKTAIAVRRSGQPKPLELPVELEGEPVRVGIAWRLDDAEPGVVILTTVLPDSPAAGAGLQAGDRILKLAGRDVAGEAEFARLVRTLPGPLELQIERNGRLLRVIVHLDGEHLRRAA